MGSDMEQKEITQKKAALWVHYSHLSMGMNGKSVIIDNGARIEGEHISLKHPPENNLAEMDKNERMNNEVPR